MTLKEIQDLIRFVAKSGVGEVQIEQKDFKLVIKTPVQGNHSQQPVQQHYFAAPQPQVQQHPAAQPKPNPAPVAETGSTSVDEDQSKYETIRSPMIGTFYRRPSPDKEVFVKPGDTINKGEPVCVIEAMKLFNEIESDISGRIVKVLVEDSSPVEYDQPLFLVEPA
ncbi:MAG: acetyl-CoA carboxylase biotin carboxyl carrier protein [Bacteroidota bacterium]|nr:acetyl-CoA carboxylase biotin carboxyl carrier protein [Bacteroidota bacterium]